VLTQVRQNHIAKINKESPYKAINIQDKNEIGDNTEEQASQMNKLSNLYKKKYGSMSDNLKGFHTPLGGTSNSSRLGIVKEQSVTTAEKRNSLPGGGFQWLNQHNVRMLML
jgi:hypothetical protein